MDLKVLKRTVTMRQYNRYTRDYPVMVVVKKVRVMMVEKAAQSITC